MVMRLASAISIDWKCGEIIVFLPTLPKVPCGETMNDAGSNHLSPAEVGVGVDRYPVPTPEKLGRSGRGLLVPALLKPIVRVIGTPLWMVEFVLSCHPPTKAFSAPLFTFKSLPLPIGRS